MSCWRLCETINFRQSLLPVLIAWLFPVALQRRGFPSIAKR